MENTCAGCGSHYFKGRHLASIIEGVIPVFIKDADPQPVAATHKREGAKGKRNRTLSFDRFNENVIGIGGSLITFQAVVPENTDHKDRSGNTLMGKIIYLNMQRVAGAKRIYLCAKFVGDPNILNFDLASTHPEFRLVGCPPEQFPHSLRYDSHRDELRHE